MSSNRFRSRAVVLATAISAVAMLGGMPSAVAGGSSAYELDQSVGREIVLTNLGTYPGVLVIPGNRHGSEIYNTEEITAEDAGVTNFKGSQVGSGDIDGDGDGDLVISVPNAATLSREGAGKLVVVPGDEHGPDTESAYSVENLSATSTAFGKRMLVADIDRDGYQDVAVIANDEGDPEVTILWGGATPLSGASSTTFNGPRGSVLDLVAANLRGDEARELTLIYGGKPKTSSTDGVRGRIVMCPVRSNHSVSCGNAVLTAKGITDAATGNVAGTSRQDLVLGQPRNDNNKGRVLVYKGKDAGLAEPTFVSQNSDGVPGTDETGDRFGEALAVEDMDGDGRQDVAIGAPQEAKGGRVTILYGHQDGLGQGRSAGVSQTHQAVPGNDELGDRFGAGVSLLDINGDGRRDLVIGAPGEDGKLGSLFIIRSYSGGKPNLSTTVRANPEDLNIDNPACCGNLGVGNRIGQ